MHVLATFLAAALSPVQASVDEATVRDVIERAIVIDLHSDTTQLILEEDFNLAERHDYAQVDIPRMREGGYTAMYFATNPNSRQLSPLESIERGLEEVDAIRREVARHPADLALATTSSEIEEAKRAGKVAILIGIEGGHVIDSNLAVLRAFHALGARYMTLTHFTHTPWADSSGEPPRSHGLTDFGRDVVREMNRLGMIIDVSHVSDDTFYQTLEASTAPVIASHSSCRVFSDHPRNMSDDMLRALAEDGGVVHINYYNPYLDEEHRERDATLDLSDLDLPQRELNRERISRIGRVPLSRLVDHFEHAVEVAGIDHVGLGSDFDGVADQLPEGMEDASKTGNLVRELLARGYSAQDVTKILGANTLRVMREVEAQARTR